MKEHRLAILSLLALVLWACTPPPPPSLQGLQGHVFTSPSAGGQPVHGAKVVAKVGNKTLEATTGLDGSFSLQIPGNAQTFTLTVIPPAGQGMAALTYENVPVAAYKSPYGAASEMNIYLPAPASRTLPGYPTRTGYVAGTVTLNGDPVASATPRGSSQLFDPPAPCEDGLVVFGGSRTVTTDNSGQYQIPVASTNNLYAVSGSLWAGNYMGTDTGNCNTATEYYWSEFQYIPEIRVYLNGSTTSQDVTLEAFDPGTNPSRVVSLQVTHDYSGLSGFHFDPNDSNWNAYAVSIPSFVHAIHSGEVELGQYYFLGQTTKTVRVYNIPPGTTAQQIAFLHRALRLDPNTSQLKGRSWVYQWRDGTNLSQGLTAKFLDTPKPQVNDGANLGTNPTLSWSPVSGAKVYVVSVYDAQGALVWAGFTPNTSVTVPVSLQSGVTYFWDIYTNDQTEMLDYIGMDPAALQARLYVDLNHYPRLKHLQTSPVNRYRGELARVLREALGYLPGPQAAYQNLLQNGYRESVSETRSFTVQ